MNIREMRNSFQLISILLLLCASFAFGDEYPLYEIQGYIGTIDNNGYNPNQYITTVRFKNLHPVRMEAGIKSESVN